MPGNIFTIISLILATLGTIFALAVILILLYKRGPISRSTAAVVLGFLLIILVWIAANLQSLVKMPSVFIDRSNMVISQPKDGEIVGIHEAVAGRSPFRSRNNYLVVTDMPYATNYIQPGPLALDIDGNWQTTAQFGGASNCGVQFAVRFFATSAALSAEPIPRFPDDSVFSPAVNVRREQCKD